MTEHEGATIDLDQVRASIDEEVRRRRASGEIPADLERELDRAFARFVPMGTTGGDFEQVLARAEQAAFIDVLVPVASARPGVGLVKRALRKLFTWYMRYIAQQVGVVANELARALRMLGERVTDVENATQQIDEVLLSRERATRPAPSLDAWADAITGAFTGVKGRVVHAECGTGSVLARLREAGIDAYGVEPVVSWATEATRLGLEVRTDEALTHLRLLGRGVLAGVVLSGFVERLSTGRAIEVVGLIAAKVAPGGVVVLTSADPSTWARTASPVELDLTPGRPLHADTWRLLFESAGLKDFRQLSASSTETTGYAVVATRPE